jgi:hypothetical protein
MFYYLEGKGAQNADVVRNTVPEEFLPVIRLVSSPFKTPSIDRK